MSPSLSVDLVQEEDPPPPDFLIPPPPVPHFVDPDCQEKMLTNSDLLHLSSYLIIGCILLLIFFTVAACSLRCCTRRYTSDDWQQEGLLENCEEEEEDCSSAECPMCSQSANSCSCRGSKVGANDDYVGRNRGRRPTTCQQSRKEAVNIEDGDRKSSSRRQRSSSRNSLFRETRESFKLWKARLRRSLESKSAHNKSRPSQQQQQRRQQQQQRPPASAFAHIFNLRVSPSERRRRGQTGSNSTSCNNNEMDTTQQLLSRRPILLTSTSEDVSLGPAIMPIPSVSGNVQEWVVHNT